jgi:3-oxoacid CoA-transferase subunit B
MFSIDRKGGAGMSLIELAAGVSADEVRAKTAAGFKASLVSMPAAADSRTCALS